ncbi:hypothetical protein BSY48_004412 [Salmonella enterica subsp. enterica serovar Agbeni]|nr:hypothetical protein [Salmonella enterica subsp. enterica serovar Agbeni]
MSKIAKFIKSALNNSSANEAAQALKMAAVTMQKDGINPADFLQEKGETSNAAELEALKREVSELTDTNNYWIGQYKEAMRNLDSAKRATANTSAIDALKAELREAKELAIKWHKRAEAQESHLKDLAPIAVEAQEKANRLEADNKVLVSRCRFFGVAGVLAALVCFGLGMNSADTEKAYNRGKWDGVTQESQEKAKLATCYVEKKEKGKVSTIKVWYNAGDITVFEDGETYSPTKQQREGINSRSDFTNDLNNRFKNVSCNLGVNQ